MITSSTSRTNLALRSRLARSTIRLKEDPKSSNRSRNMIQISSFGLVSSSDGLFLTAYFIGDASYTAPHPKFVGILSYFSFPGLDEFKQALEQTKNNKCNYSAAAQRC